jgi:hypothetical protein
MKKLLALVIFAAGMAFSASAYAAEGSQSKWEGPYKTRVMRCDGAGQSIELLWDHSQAPLIWRIMVNGVNEKPGMLMEFGPDSVTYSKPGVFTITTTEADNRPNFTKTVEIGTQKIEMDCTYSEAWHLW